MLGNRDWLINCFFFFLLHTLILHFKNNIYIWFQYQWQINESSSMIQDPPPLLKGFAHACYSILFWLHPAGTVLSNWCPLFLLEIHNITNVVTFLQLMLEPFFRKENEKQQTKLDFWDCSNLANYSLWVYTQHTDTVQSRFWIMTTTFGPLIKIHPCNHLIWNEVYPPTQEILCISLETMRG